MATNFTPNLHLPQWVAGDKPNFLSEINGAWAAIDLGYGQNKTDAATAVDTANGASANAQDAVSKVNALAAQLVTMQQILTQLEADYVNSKYLVVDQLNFTPANGVVSAALTAFHNSYVGKIYGEITLDVGTIEATESVVVFGTLSGFPYTFKTMDGNSNLVPFSSAISATTGTNSPLKSCRVHLKNTGELSVITGLNSGITTSTRSTIAFVIDFPIFTSAKARGVLLENCAYLEEK